MDIIDLTNSPPAKRQKRDEDIIDLCTPEASPMKTSVSKVSPETEIGVKEDREDEGEGGRREGTKKMKTKVKTKVEETKLEETKTDKTKGYKQYLVVIPNSTCLLCGSLLGRGVISKAGSNLGKEFMSCTSVDCKYFRYVKK